jgi:ribonuclease E
MLIDARHPEETRVAVIHGNRVEEFDYESVAKRQLKGNIYLAKVTRVEPSLQACFVDYGGNRHGFLAFSEIHPDYYQIPAEDRDALMAEVARETASDALDNEKSRKKQKSSANSDAANADDDAEQSDDADETSDVEQISGEDDYEDDGRRRAHVLRRHYKIQEVIKRRQILLIQVVKEERGTKGAALTTYLSLAGRYCVLMPNSQNGGGISRKIANSADRKKLKDVMSSLQVPEGMGCIIRTAGLNRTKVEIKRDFDYLVRLWDGIRDRTLSSIAPALIHEEADLIKRSIRDLYSREIDEIQVEGEEGYKLAKGFMKLLMPSHARRVQHYKDRIPLFHRYQVENQLEAMYSPIVQLKSGGYIVINPTEALIAIDVNSGRSTKEHNIEETAYKTNLEAADEVARQLRLRDLAGLIVIDFIDMEDRGNNRSVEKRMKDALKSDRARIQVGRVSSFGLMEMSRQRLRPNLLEASMITCGTCNGAGVVPSVEMASLNILRALEEEGIRDRSAEITIKAPFSVAFYLLNNKRSMLTDLEQRYDYTLSINADAHLGIEPWEMERVAKTPEQIAAGARDAARRAAEAPALIDESDLDDDLPENDEDDAPEHSTSEPSSEPSAEKPAEKSADQRAADKLADANDDEGGRKKRRRRRRRGRRGRGGDDQQNAQDQKDQPDQGDQGDSPRDAAEGDQPSIDPQGNADQSSLQEGAKDDQQKPRRRPRRRRSRGSDEAAGPAQPNATNNAEGSADTAAQLGEPSVSNPAENAPDTGDDKPRRRRRVRRKSPSGEAASLSADADPAPAILPAAQSPDGQSLAEQTSEASDDAAVEAVKKPRRRRKAAKAPDEAAKDDAATEAAGNEAEAEKPVKPKAPRRRAPAKAAAKKPAKAGVESESTPAPAPEAAPAAIHEPKAATVPAQPEPQVAPAPQATPEARPAPAEPAAPAPDVLERQIVTPDGVKEEKLEEKGEADSGKRKRGWWQRALGR